MQPTQLRSSGLALTLSSSHLGFHVHAGVLDALIHNVGVHPAHIGAASSGALVGGLFATGFAPREIHELLLERRMAKAFFEWRGLLRGLGMLANLPGFTGLLRGHKIAAFLRDILGHRLIENCSHAELSIAVTNLRETRSQIIRQGDLAAFIAASCAVPALFQAAELDHHLLWDGAVADSSPFHHFLDDPRVTDIIIHTVDHSRLFQSHSKLSITDALGRAHQIISDRFLSLSVECARLRGKRVHLLPSSVPTYSFRKAAHPTVAAELFEIGRQTVLSRLPELLPLAVPPHRLDLPTPLSLGTGAAHD